jgi:hypothetical protein
MTKNNQRQSRSDKAAKHLFGHGRLSYIQIPALDVAESAKFYKEVLKRITAGGGEVVKSPYSEGDLLVATFRDPAGNVIGIWQQGPR